MPIPSRTEDVPRTPEELYERLTVKDSAIGALWRHQSHALEVYFEGHRDQPDVALEFPTGSGKTLVGLLIADWRRRTTGASSAFVCPTKQLAAQAHEKALGYGVPTVLLVGSSRGWNEADRTRGLGAGATIITTYSHIFNVRPRINATTLVLDDAHAGESYVSQHWSLRLSRTHPGYRAAVEMLKDVLEDGRADALLDDSLSPAARGVPSFVGPAALAPIAPSLVEVLEATVDEGEDASYALFTLRDSLAACACYVAWNELCIRPVVPPTKFHSAFAGAAQRVYLSATLGDAGELERSFGLTRIPRIAMPAEWERHGSGRRLVLLPGAGMPLAEAGAFVETTIRELPRALILVPSDAQLDDGAAFAPDDWDVLRRDDVDAALEPFRSSSESVLVLANRYDGMDLPGDDCRLILMFGLPSGTNLQERFLFETLHADAALRERIRTRIVQGMGRATRSRTDRALVI
ncbi:MAG: DEAD/DEAH box helicase, partial [Solirubrobacteraceae bacterium]|nr:DEAD/DEAH box helicase [Solirubrobacteraceae bacterium]